MMINQLVKSENAKMQSLSNDLVRRLLNTKEELPPEYRAEVIDHYGVKLRTSGYSMDQTRKILTNGMKGYVAKVRRRRKSGSRIHRTAKESSFDRNRKKLIGRSNWYKGSRKNEDEEQSNVQKTGRGAPGSSLGAVDKTIKTRAVLFVDQTPKGELAKLVREHLHKLEGVMGFRLRVVERTGRNILSNFQQTRTWSGLQCGREECVTCHQGGEELPNCTRSGVVYESICTTCNPDALKKGELEKMREGPPSLYVGETSRSIQERAREHWGAATRGEEESHMVRHQALVHEGVPPVFLFKVISSHKTALSRQIKEAVRIRRRGGGGRILNSKSEYNRCQIPRLVVETEDEDKRDQRLATEKRSRENMKTVLEDRDKDWSEQRLCNRDKADKKRGRIPILFDDEQKPKRRKRMKYSLLEDDWGAEEVGDSVLTGGEENLAQGLVATPVPVMSRPPPPQGEGERGRGIPLLMFHLLQSTLIRRGWSQSRRMEVVRRLGWVRRRTK